jgi:prepilin-type N-terminal cleavage/methylation domain-containing protein
MKTPRFIILRKRNAGFTLMEMVITLFIFLLLTAAVFGLMSGVLQSTGSLQDNQNRHDQEVAFTAYLKKRLNEMPAGSSVMSYQRGDGSGLAQNGIVFGTVSMARAIDATMQSNGYYQIRTTQITVTTSPDAPSDARQVLLGFVTADDPSLVWTPLMSDIKTLDWKFLDFNQTVWVDLWTSPTKPNLLEFSMQPAGELQPTTMDFWLPAIASATTNRGGGGGGGGGGAAP